VRWLATALDLYLAFGDGKAVLGVRWLATALDFVLTEAALPEKSGTKVPHSKDRCAISCGNRPGSSTFCATGIWGREADTDPDTDTDIGTPMGWLCILPKGSYSIINS
jgi:hypothetical protein